MLSPSSSDGAVERRPSTSDARIGAADAGVPLRSEILDRVVDPDDLAPLWLDLEARADGSFFRSWAWIGCWLRCLPAEVRPRRALLVRAGTEVVGLATLGDRRTVRRGGIRSRGLYLNETGDPACDVVAIEYNGVLADRRFVAPVVRTALTALAADEGWDELHLSGLDPRQTDVCRNAAKALGLREVVTARKRCDRVDLDAVRQSGGDYLGALSANTRYQIRRALRRYAALGRVALDPARTPGEALAFLDRLKALHQAAWTRRGRPGAFAGPFFEPFHRALVAARFEAGEIQLLRLRAGGEEIGYLYNFVHRGVVHAYQSGFRFDPDPKLKPGLVSHSLAVEHNLARGARIYDFMAGANQYKASLGTAAEEMHWLVLQRNRVRFRLERALRSVADALRERRPTPR